MKTFLLAASLLLVAPHGPTDALVKATTTTKFSVNKTEAEWKKLLPKNSFLILRKSGTEKPYTGKYWDLHIKGTYQCAGCNLNVFNSESKFDSQTGWPSFFKEIAKGRTLVKEDLSEGDPRTEVICSRCGGHLGHVFEDGPEPTGLRYCMNSPALKFVPAK